MKWRIDQLNSSWVELTCIGPPGVSQVYVTPAFILWQTRAVITSLLGVIVFELLKLVHELHYLS